MAGRALERNPSVYSHDITARTPNAQDRILNLSLASRSGGEHELC